MRSIEMKFLFALVFVAVLSPLGVRSSEFVSNADFVEYFIGQVVTNATDADAKSCLEDLAQAADNSNFSITPDTIGFDPATRNASIVFKICLDNATDGNLKEAATNVFAMFLFVANNLADIDSAVSNECMRNGSASGIDLYVCFNASCPNVDRNLLSDIEDLWTQSGRVSRQEENQRCKAFKCYFLCAAQIQTQNCGQQIGSLGLRLLKLQLSSFLHMYLIGKTPKEAVGTLPCRCKWFFK